MSEAIDLQRRLASLTPRERYLLEERLLEVAATKAGRDPTRIPRRDVGRPVPLSSAQQRLWFIDQLQPNNSVYNIAKALRIKGCLNPDALRPALGATVARHESLRTRFPVVEGVPMQVIDREQRLDFKLTDLSHLPIGVREVTALERMSAVASRPFDLMLGPLLRIRLLRLGEQDWMLLVCLHHIIWDGGSVRLFFQDVAAAYGALARQCPTMLPELPIQYADYAVWQQHELARDALHEDLTYWRRQLAGTSSNLRLPTDYPRPTRPSYRGRRQPLALSPSLVTALRALSRREGVTLFTTLLAAVQTLLFRYSGQEDQVVGCPVASRGRTELEQVIGLLVNTLALRTDLSGNPAFSELLQRARQATLDGFSHQDLPFEKVVEALNPERILGQTPLFQVMLAYQHDLPVAPEIDGLDITPIQVDLGTSRFDLSLLLWDQGDSLAGDVEYSTELFHQATIERLIGHFQTLLEGIVADPAQRLSDLPMLSAAERHQLLVEWNATTTVYPRDRCVHELFEAYAAQTPDALAVVFEDQQLTYRELNTRANHLAHHLRALGVGPERLVALCLGRSIEMVVGLLGILKAGAAYVPLDPDYPPERLAYLLRDTQASVLLTLRRWQRQLPEHQATVVCLDHDWEAISQQSEANPTSGATADNLAYVIYTSGSTGSPKGVLIEHRSVVRLVKQTQYARLTADEVVLQLAPLSFDASTFEIWGSLLNGARLVVFPDRPPSLAELGQVIKAGGVTTLWLTAGLFHQVVAADLPALRGLRQLLAGGDVLAPRQVQAALRQLGAGRLINGYGPTESTTFACCYPLSEPGAPGRSVPIGRPIANTQVYILDPWLNPVPIGVAGELHIGGDGLARGYLHQPDLTAEKFIPNPFNHEPGARLYRTGDLARYLADGNIELLGRLDQQVKIRGFRVEPAEVEAAILEHPGVREVRVIAREDRHGDQRLAAYLVAAQDPPPAVTELQRFLRAKLPEYLLPAAFVPLPALPLTPNGKLDRQALPSPDPARPAHDQACISPRSPVEELLAGIWEELLDVRPIGVTDSFFDLGGHSLLAVRLFAEIARISGRVLPLSSLFSAATIEQLARALVSPESVGSGLSLVPIQPRGSKPPFFCVHGIDGDVLAFAGLARHLDPGQPFYGLRAKGLDGTMAPLTDVRAMANRYITELRTVQTSGPYYLGGYSFGSHVAFEMARQLLEAGQTVALLVVLDTSAHYSAIRVAMRRSEFWLRLVSEGVRSLPGWLPAKQRCRSDELPQDYRSRARLVKRWLIQTMQGVGLDPPAWLIDLGTREHLRADADWLTRVVEPNEQALCTYVTGVYPGRLTLLRGPDSGLLWPGDPTLGWGAIVRGGVDVRQVSGNHQAMLREPHVQLLAAQLTGCLAGALSEYRTG